MNIRVALFCTILMYVTAKDDKSLFERDISFDDKLPEEIPLQGILSISHPRCARYCHSSTTCSTFVHNRLSGKCQLFSEVSLTRQSGSELVGNVMFKKIATTIQQGEATDRACSPPSIPHGKLLGIVAQAQGCKAYFVCDELYFPTVLHGVFSGNVWTGLTEPCEFKNKIPSDLRPIGGLHTGQCVIIETKTPSADAKTSILLQSEDGSQKFLNVQFKINEKMIDRRANLDGVSFAKESGLPYWPLAVGTDVIVKVCIEETLFRIHIDSVEMFTYVRRPSNHTMVKMRFLAFNVTTIVFTDLT